jgi:hypothetical protein
MARQQKRRSLQKIALRLKTWGQEATLADARETYDYMVARCVRLDRLREPSRVEFSQKAQTEQQQREQATELYLEIRGKLDTIDARQRQRWELHGDVARLARPMKSVLDNLREGRYRDVPEGELPRQVRNLRTKLDALNDWGQEQLLDYCPYAVDPRQVFVKRKGIDLYEVLGAGFDDIILHLRSDLRYEDIKARADLGTPLEEARRAVLQRLRAPNTYHAGRTAGGLRARVGHTQATGRDAGARRFPERRYDGTGPTYQSSPTAKEESSPTPQRDTRATGGPNPC